MNRNGWIGFSADLRFASGCRKTGLLVPSSGGETFVIAVEDQVFAFDGEGARILTQIGDWQLDDTNTISRSGACRTAGRGSSA